MVEKNNILINQIGYIKSREKRAVFRGSAMADTFDVVRADGSIAGTYPQSEPFYDRDTDETVRYGYFTDADLEGTFYLKAGDDTSYESVIADDPYADLKSSLLHMLTLQRCGCELTEEMAGDFAHPPCHDRPAVVYGSDERIDVTGGWHDAGDYGRYIVPAAKAVTELLMTFKVTGDEKLVEEARYETDWMLKMQRSDGGVYHKVTGYSFPEMDTFPEEETWDMVVSPVSNASCACFAAAMAYVYCVLKDSDPSYADTCIRAGIRAMDYISDHKNMPGFKNPPDIFTGEYGDDNWKDEWFWAAAAMLKATGEEKYRTLAEELMEDQLTQGFGWEETGLYGALFYIRSQNADPKKRSALLKRMEDITDKYLEASWKNAYRQAVTDGKYIWGSNSIIANMGMLFLIMSEKEGVDDQKKKACREAALCQMDHLLGVNGNGYCYVTGYGSKKPLHPHHRPSVKLQKAMKGMLVGGPDDGLQDDVAREKLAGSPPALCYADDWMSYSTNEITIYWNTPLLFLIAGITEQRQA